MKKKVETVEGLLLYERQRADSYYDKLMEEQSWNEELESELRKQILRVMSQERALTNEGLKVNELESQLDKARLEVDLLENVIKDQELKILELSFQPSSLNDKAGSGPSTTNT